MIIDAKISGKFCEECQTAYECWATCRTLFDEFPVRAGLSEDEIHETPVGRCFVRVSTMSWHYCIVQIARLHDRTFNGKNVNLSIGLLQEHGNWTAQEGRAIEQIMPRLGALYTLLKPARDKIIAHNDLAIRLADKSLGAFGEGRVHVRYGVIRIE